MDLRIGVMGVPHQLSMSVDLSEEEIMERVNHVCAHPEQTCSFQDAKGRTIVIPGRTLAYVEMNEEAPRHVGFGLH